MDHHGHTSADDMSVCIQEDLFFHKYFTLQSVKKAREARQTAKNLKKSKASQKKDSLDQQRSFLQQDDSVDDLESLQSLDLGDDVDMEDGLDEMFASATEENTKLPNELFDYSDLMQDIAEADEDSIDSSDEGNWTTSTL